MNQKKVDSQKDIRTSMLAHEAQVLARFRGDREFLREIYTVFLSEIPEKNRMIEQAKATLDFGAIGEVAHALRSSGATIGVEVCSCLAAKLEEAAAHKNFDEVISLNDELYSVMMEIAAVIEERLRSI